MPSQASTLPSTAHTEPLVKKHQAYLDWVSVKVVLALLSAALLVCALPSPDIGWLAWIALVPLIVACDGVAPMRAAGIGFVHGYVAAFGIYNWLFQLPAFGWRHAFLLAAYVALYSTLFCFALASFNRRQAPLLFTVPALWTVVEYLRANAGFLALPWGTLAHAQHENLAILQFASIAGEYGVTFMVVLGNAAIAQVILGTPTAEARRTQRERTAAEALGGFTTEHTEFTERRERSVLVLNSSIGTLRPQRLRGEVSEFFSILAAIAIIALAHAWGVYVLYSERPGPTLRVAAIQPNIQIAERANPATREASFKRLETLTRKAAASKPELIVWPESAIPGNLQSNPHTQARLQDLVREIGIPIVLGVAEVEKFIVTDGAKPQRPKAYNSGYVIAPGEPLSLPYHKRRLLPFGEYMPLRGWLSWPSWIAPDVSDMTPGDQTQLFKLPNGLKIGTLICWENLFANLSQESVNNGAQVLVQLTNDVWFGNTAAPHQHNLMSILRAVETRTPIVIASNTGPSQIIDAYGRVVSVMTSIYQDGIVAGEINLARR